ncbi:MAG TPA: hypothetical protein VEJ23_02570, partial [Solirubrobacteraceae bacterium]|nr:hypothetical protein [Solirubrobacteraceae bacterium]
MSAWHADRDFALPTALLRPARSSGLARRCLLAMLSIATVAIAAVTAWQGDAWQVRGGDYSADYAASTNALLVGRIGAFFAHLPVNGAGGSILLRAPFSELGRLIIGDQLAIYRFGALMCLLALGALGLYLAADTRRGALPWAAVVGVIALLAGAPAALEAVVFGHPEEALGAALCVGAVLAADAGAPGVAGAALGLALVNKPWGVLAVAPVLLCARAQWRRALWPAATILGCWLLADLLVAPSHALLTVAGAQASIVAHPQDVWWPLSHMDGLYPVPPALLADHARTLAVLLALVAAGALVLRARGARIAIDGRRCLALLALGFALRCLLDPSDHVYYELPFVVALGAWELRAHRSLVISLATTILLRLDFGRLGQDAATIPYVLYLAIVLPLCAMLLADLLGERRRGRRRAPAAFS